MPPSSRPALMAALTSVVARKDRWLRVARRRGASLAEAEDALQSGIARALAKVDQLRDPAHAEAWVARIVGRELGSELRRRREVVRPDQVPDAPPVQGEDPCHCVLAQVRTLGPLHREVLELSVLAELDHAEVATALGISVNAATVRVHRAKAALRAAVAAHCGTTSVRSCADCGCLDRGCCAPPP